MFSITVQRALRMAQLHSLTITDYTHSMKKSWYVYIVRCNDDTLYTGCTNNISERIKKHNTGKGAKYTKTRRPVTLNYREKTLNRSKALSRELAIKKLSRDNKLILIKKWRDAERRQRSHAKRGDVAQLVRARDS